MRPVAASVVVTHSGSSSAGASGSVHLDSPVAVDTLTKERNTSRQPVRDTANQHNCTASSRHTHQYGLPEAGSVTRVHLAVGSVHDVSPVDSLAQYVRPDAGSGTARHGDALGRTQLVSCVWELT